MTPKTHVLLTKIENHGLLHYGIMNSHALCASRQSHTCSKIKIFINIEAQVDEDFFFTEISM